MAAIFSSSHLNPGCAHGVSTRPLIGKAMGDFAKTVTGKIQKYKMREVSLAELGLEQPANKAT
jgi:hypothetical protein